MFARERNSCLHEFKLKETTGRDAEPLELYFNEDDFIED